MQSILICRNHRKLRRTLARVSILPDSAVQQISRLIPVLLFALLAPTFCPAAAGNSKEPSNASAGGLPADWAFRPLTRPALPQAPASLPAGTNPIDDFIHAKLAEHGFAQIGRAHV